MAGAFPFDAGLHSGLMPASVYQFLCHGECASHPASPEDAQ